MSRHIGVRHRFQNLFARGGGEWAILVTSAGRGGGGGNHPRAKSCCKRDSTVNPPCHRRNTDGIPTRYSPSSEPRHPLVARAGDEVVVDHSDRLHEGIDDGGAAEFESAFLQIFRNFYGKIGLRRHLREGLPTVLNGPPTDMIPKVAVKALLGLDRLPRPGISDGRLDLAPVPDDAGIIQ